MDELRSACAEVAQRARAASGSTQPRSRLRRRSCRARPPAAPIDPEPGLDGSREQLAAFWLTLDAVNFGSGWFPTLRKRDGRSGYHTISAALAERFARTARGRRPS